MLQKVFAFSLFGEPSFPLLREDQRVVVEDLENPAAARLQRDTARQPIVVFVENGNRQTGGPFEVASGGAVLNADVSLVRCHRVAFFH